MSATRFVMRRDTRKHMPPRPGLHPHPVPPEQPRHPRSEPHEGREFWREEERRHDHAPGPEPRRESQREP